MAYLLEYFSRVRYLCVNRLENVSRIKRKYRTTNTANETTREYENAPETIMGRISCTFPSNERCTLKLSSANYY